MATEPGASKSIRINLAPVNGIPMNLSVTQEKVDELADFPLLSDDLFIVSYPKSGTTWLQQIVKLIRAKGEDDGVPGIMTIPWIEADEALRKLLGSPPQDLKTIPSPRTYKTHSPYFMMAGGPPVQSPAKYIYVARNPKDTAVSFFHHTQALIDYEYEGDWDDFFERFMTGNVDHGSWFDHVLKWWEHRDSPNILFLTFEELKKDGVTAIAKITNFMGCSLEPPIVDSIVHQTRFDAMKTKTKEWKNARKPGAESHMRKGVVGDWRNYFSEEQSARLDAECHKKFSGTGLEFLYEQL